MICPQCSTPFEPTRPHQRFHHPKCRQAYHASGDGGLRGAVTSVRILARGQVSVVVRFAPIDRDNALSLTPGAVVEVVG